MLSFLLILSSFLPTGLSAFLQLGAASHLCTVQCEREVGAACGAGAQSMTEAGGPETTSAGIWQQKEEMVVVLRVE